MDDPLLSYYNRELNYLRKSGAEFSEKYPKIAGRLRLDKDIVEDPHVSRLIESFAFITARIRHSLDDGFPELTESLMGVLYPDYHAPVPSMSVVEFTLLEQLQQKISISRGEELRLEDSAGNSCFYRTCSDIEVLPIKVKSSKFYSLPVKAPLLPESIQDGKSVQSILKIKISPSDGVSPFDFDANNLRFYINSQPNISFSLYQALLTNTIGIAVARDAFDDDPYFIKSNAISACGFGEEERMLDFDGRASSAHRLLAEYFLFPQKFLFVDIGELSGIWEKYVEGFELYIYFDSASSELIRGVDDRTFMLGCAPIVNMFDGVSEPIQASELSGEVMLRVSEQTSTVADIYRVDEVYAINSQGDRKTIQPFYGRHRSGSDSESDIYWSLRRDNSAWQKGEISHGTDAYLTFVDINHQIIQPESGWVINANLTCLNRDQPNKLPFGPNQPPVYFVDGGAGLRINCLTPPTSTVLPKLNDSSRWQLVAQLSLQHFSGNDGLLKLKETLKLYNLNDSKDVFSLINGIVAIESSVKTARILDNGRSAMCQGTLIEITCDESFYTGSGLYLFGCVIDEFLSQFCAINTFTELSIKTTKHSRVELKWRPRTGCQPLV